MAITLLQLFGFDDSYNLEINIEQRLSIHIGHYHPELKRDEDVSYNIMQLVGYMIASAQENYIERKVVFPNRMIGILVVGFNIKFCSLDISKDYLDELYYSLPNNNRCIFRISDTFDSLEKIFIRVNKLI